MLIPLIPNITINMLFLNLMATVPLFLLESALDREARLSMILGPQFDRALIFKAYLATQTLVKSKPKEQVPS